MNRLNRSAIMQDSTAPNTQPTDPFEVVQRFIATAPQVHSAWREQMQKFWSSQEKILDSMTEFSDGWFERRHEGTRLARKAVGEMCNGATPVDAAIAFQTWLAGSMARMVADGMSLQKHLTNVAGLMAVPGTAEPGRPAKSKPAPVQRDAA
jgi:hypothetical protein